MMSSPVKTAELSGGGVHKSGLDMSTYYGGLSGESAKTKAKKKEIQNSQDRKIAARSNIAHLKLQSSYS